MAIRRLGPWEIGNETDVEEHPGEWAPMAVDVSEDYPSGVCYYRTAKLPPPAPDTHTILRRDAVQAARFLRGIASDSPKANTAGKPDAVRALADRIDPDIEE